MVTRATLISAQNPPVSKIIFIDVIVIFITLTFGSVELPNKGWEFLCRRRSGE